ncbi:MAG TPA: MmcQ/YjbR family DNA-binding protein [Taishania sp.]|nr:MmcQ/YjbR family DNA-binding protein [Taishania sp.]
MTFEEVCTYCLAKVGCEETYPFDQTTLVFKVGGKMFALIDVVDWTTINLKCDPERAIELREQYAEIIPGYHMNKTHWNTVQLNGSLSNQLIYELIDHSYELVFNSLPKKIKLELKADF